MPAPVLRPLALAAALGLSALAPAGAMAAGEVSAILQQDLLTEPGFLRHHPDLRYQRAGVAAWERGDLRDAHRAFLDASRYGNKMTQAMVAEMLWTGQGAPQDRAQAYAWMDLAAERGYKALLVMRERYWNALDEHERTRAIEIGTDVFAEYGDDVAKPRLETELRRGRNRSTGSRLGANRSAVEVYTGVEMSAMYRNPFAGGMLAARQHDYYDDRYWSPRRYWRWQDALLNQLPAGTVSVLPPRPIGE